MIYAFIKHVKNGMVSALEFGCAEETGATEVTL